MLSPHWPSPRWRKLLRDAWLHKSRTLLVVLAITTGLIGTGALINTWALVERATAEGYRSSQPVSATLEVDRIDADLMSQVGALPGIAHTRARRTVAAAVQVGGTWHSATLYAFDDFRQTDIGRLQPETGTWPPVDAAVVIEQSSLEYAAASLGEPLTLAFAKNPSRALTMQGSARDVSLAPGWMEHTVYAFVTPATLEALGAPSTFNELQIRVSDPGADRIAVRRIAFAAKALIERNGGRVSNVDVPEPGQHIHAAQMNSLLMTQGAFALLVLLVCGFLVVNLVSALLAGQVREIGVLKSLGASNGQIARMYLGLMLLLGLLAAALALPAAMAIGYRYAEFKGEMLNFPVVEYEIPFWVIVAQILGGGLLPVAAALVPVARSCRRPVSAALRDVGIVAADGGLHLRRMIGWSGLARPLLLSLNNAFRRRQRLCLTVLALAAGGAVFIGAGNLRNAVRGSIDLLFSSQQFDLSLRLAEPHPLQHIEATAAGVSGVAGAEAWMRASAVVAHADGTFGNRFALTALPFDSSMLAPPLERGRWLQDSDSHSLVVSRRLLGEEPGLVPGSGIRLLIDGQTTHWTVVGIVDAGPQLLAYANRSAIAAWRGNEQASTVVVASTLHSTASQLDLVARLRVQFERAGMPVASSQLKSENRRVVADHLLMVVDFLGVMAWVMVAVGGMGLASSMSLAVLERTREIGVLRAIGARHRAIMAMTLTEGLVIALLGWLVALPLSVPISAVLADAFGRVMFAVPTLYLPDLLAVLRWLGLVVGVGLLACAWPALRATRIPTAAALGYE